MLTRLMRRIAKGRASRRVSLPVSRHSQRHSRKRAERKFIDKSRPFSPARLVFMAATMAALPPVLQAQNRPTDTTVLLTGPNFLITLIAGLILAVAFQLILTNLSIAAGLNAIGPFGERKNITRAPKANSEVRGVDDDSASAMGAVRKITSGFGLWSLVTASVALFFASWLSVELSFTPDMMTGAVLGLVIWGLFYVTMMVVEANLFSSLIGSLMRIATAGVRTAYRIATSVLGKSDEDRLAETAAKVTSAVKEELFGDIDDFKDQIKDYIKELKPKEINADKIRDEITALLDETEIRAITRPNSQLDEETVLRFVHKGRFNKDQMQTVYRGVKGAFQKVRDEARSDKDKVAKVTDAALRVAGVPAEEATRYRLRVEDYMRSTGREELDPDALKRDLETFFRDPRTLMNALGDRIAKIDRGSVTALVAQREGMSPEQAEQYVGKVYSVIDRVKNRVRGNGGDSDSGDSEGMRTRVSNKIRDYLDSMQIPSINYDTVSQDFQRMFRGELKGGASDFVGRLRSLSRDDLRNIIATRRDIPQEEAERLIMRIEDARDSVIDRYNRTASEVKRRALMAREEALRQVEEVRKTAASAAWWVLGAAAVSGIAAVLGGILGASNGYGM